MRILVGSFHFAGVSTHRVGAAELEVGERANRFIQHNAPMVEDLLNSAAALRP